MVDLHKAKLRMARQAIALSEAQIPYRRPVIVLNRSAKLEGKIGHYNGVPIKTRLQK
ncbi:MAG TPA: hypothetical protein VF748_14635 [Candidatus Acidoferrum sp.]